MNAIEDRIGQFIGSAANGPHRSRRLLDGEVGKQTVQDVLQTGGGGDVDDRRMRQASERAEERRQSAERALAAPDRQ